MSTADGYTITGETVLAAPAAHVVPWLTLPELMERWMLGVDGIVVLDEGDGSPGTRIQAITSSGRHAGWTFGGELLEVGEDRVIRRYALEELRVGNVPKAADTRGYSRTVTYGLHPAGEGLQTRLTCVAVTVIPGLDAKGAGVAVKAEQRTLTRSLERLEAEIAGRGRGLIGRFRDAGNAPSAL